MKICTLFITLALLITSSAQASSNYYPTDAKNIFEQENVGDEELKILLFNVLSQSHQRSRNGNDTLGCSSNSGSCYQQRSLGYKGARKVLFGKLHLEEDSKGYLLKDVYCDKEYRRSNTKIGPNTIPNNNIINCEHTWPQSRFSRKFSKGLQKSDLHHLFPTDSKANSKRGNVKFGESNNSQPVSGCGASRFDKRSNTYEPPTFHKGNVARALFYFSIRYQIKIDSKEERVLRQWHILDPVDSEEMDRNEGIYSVQGNRNPFIDFPELADKISDF